MTVSGFPRTLMTLLLTGTFTGCGGGSGGPNEANTPAAPAVPSAPANPQSAPPSAPVASQPAPASTPAAQLSGIVAGGVVPDAPSDVQLTSAQLSDVAINDPAVLNDPSVSLTFGDFIGAILKSRSIADTTANREAWAQTWLDTFKATSAVNRGGQTMPMTPRAEGDLPPADLLDRVTGLHLVAVLNRLDLISVDPGDNKARGAEMRAVFWLGKGEDANEKGVTRFSVVLEFNVPSIGPGKAGYRPFAQAWKDMTTMTSTEQAQRLAALFFTGLNNMPAIATADNLGLNGGQLRSNSLAPDADHSGPSWIMRESAVALQGTPNVQLRSLPGSIDPAIFKGNSPLTTEFIQAVTKILASVTVPDRAAQASGTTVTIGEFAALGLNKAEIPDKFQPMQQIGVRPDFDISQFAPPEISISITAAAKASGLPMNGHIAGNRISAGSCFGCHFPNKQALGATNFSFNTLNAMLDSNGFTQIDQDRKFSPFTLNALKVRNEFLENFLRDTAPVTAAAMLR